MKYFTIQSMVGMDVRENVTYSRWHLYFLNNRLGNDELPWHDSYRLTEQERRIAAGSIQQFQLGEWARGRGLVRRASTDPRVNGDPCFIGALKLFIAEEQRHSELLGRFLDLERIPRRRRHWIDQIFRSLRKLAGLEACVTVLVTAEVLAVPFYQALRDATRSPLLRAICRRLLCDEASHLEYQAMTLGLLQRGSSPRARRLRRVLHSRLFEGTALMVWWQHRRVFQSAGWQWDRYRTESAREFARLQSRIEGLGQASDDGVRLED